MYVDNHKGQLKHVLEGVEDNKGVTHPFDPVLLDIFNQLRHQQERLHMNRLTSTPTAK